MNLYQTLYDLIVQYIFAGQGVENGILADQMQHLVAVLVSTAGWLFCMSLPFIICTQCNIITRQRSSFAHSATSFAHKMCTRVVKLPNYLLFFTAFL